MTNSLPHDINEAALAMANEIGISHADAKIWILQFVGAKDEAQLYSLEIGAPGSAKTKGARHVIRNGREVTLLDLAEAVTSLAGIAFIQQNVDYALSAIAAGLYLIRTIKKATTIELSSADASVVWTLHELGGEATESELLNAWHGVVAASALVDATVTSEKLIARLDQLNQLGCIHRSGDKIVFAEPVEYER